MAAFKFVCKKGGLTCYFLAQKTVAKKAQVHADGWVCIKKWKAALHSLWRNVVFFLAQKKKVRAFLFLTLCSSYVWHSVHTVCIVANCIVSCPRMESVCTKMFMCQLLSHLQASHLHCWVYQVEPSYFSFQFSFQMVAASAKLVSTCGQCWLSKHCKKYIFKYSFPTYYDHQFLMCTVHFLGAFDWTLIKDIWYQDWKSDEFVIAVKANRKKVHNNDRKLFFLLLLSSSLVGALYTVNTLLAKRYLFGCITINSWLFDPAPVDLYFENYFCTKWIQWCK